MTTWRPPTAPTPPDARAAGAGPLEVFALLFLAFGSFVVWVAGPIVGVILARKSNWWSAQDKNVATGIVAAGLGLQVLLLAALFLVDWSAILSGGRG